VIGVAGITCGLMPRVRIRGRDEMVENAATDLRGGIAVDALEPGGNPQTIGSRVDISPNYRLEFLHVQRTIDDAGIT
jgi:hypothetical protein